MRCRVLPWQLCALLATSISVRMRSDLNRGTERPLNRSLNDASENLLDLIQLDPAELVPFSGLMFDGCVYFPVNGGFEHDKIGPAKVLPVEIVAPLG